MRQDGGGLTVYAPNHHRNQIHSMTLYSITPLLMEREARGGGVHSHFMAGPRAVVVVPSELLARAAPARLDASRAVD